MGVATYVSFFFFVDVAAGFLAGVFLVAGFLVAVVFLVAVLRAVGFRVVAVGFFDAVDFRVVAVGFFAAVFLVAVGSFGASGFGGAFFVEAFLFPFAGAVAGVGRPSHAGLVPIVQSTGFCA
jgi:hypothetical protein